MPAVAQLLTPKKRKTERGEFITPPRPTGRQSNYIGQLWGCRCSGVCASEKDSYSQAPASWRLEPASEISNQPVCWVPDMCLAQDKMLCFRQIDTNRQTKTIKVLSWQDSLFITCTKASLSVKNMDWLRIWCPINKGWGQWGKNPKQLYYNATNETAISHSINCCQNRAKPHSPQLCQ